MSIVLRLAAVALLIVGAVAAQAALEDSPTYPGRAHGVGIAGCEQAILGAASEPGPGDVAIGPLVIIGAKSTVSMPPNAFGNHGYKLPVTLPRGMVGTLSVPRSRLREAGLAFTLQRGKRVTRKGVRASNAAIRFTACPQGKGKKVRSGWAGGIVVDRPRCAVLQLRRKNQEPITRQVPLGRACATPNPPATAG